MNAPSVTATDTTKAPWLQDDLRPVRTPGWRRGFLPLLRKELGEWWGTRSWLIHTLISLSLISGVVAIVMTSDPSEDPRVVFLLLGMMTSALAVVVTVQDAIVGEIQRGTAAWVLSKPVSRTSFFLAKLAGYGIGFLSLWMLLPWAVFNVESRLIAGGVPEAWRLIGAMALWVVHLTFYLTLVLAVGTFFRSRAPVAAIGVGVVLSGQFFGDMIPLSITSLTPWVLPDMATAVALGRAVPVSISAAVFANLTLAAALTGVALWRLAREEL